MQGRKQNILVPVDFSECAAEVVAEATTIAHGLGVGVELLHAIDVGELDPDTPVKATSGGMKTVFAVLVDEARQSLNSLAKIPEGAGVHVETSFRTGKAVDVILAQAEETQPRMVVMGTHGRKGLSRWLLGSVAEQVVRRADVPVLTHRTQHKPHCATKSCSWCGSHITPATRRVQAELGG